MMSKNRLVTKLAEMVTVRQNYFTIVVAAQSIKDLGDETIYVDLNDDGDTIDPG